MGPDDVLALDACLDDPMLYHSSDGSFGGDEWDDDPISLFHEGECGLCRLCVETGGPDATECMCAWGEDPSCHACVSFEKILGMLPSDYEVGDVVVSLVSELAAGIVRRAIKVGLLERKPCELCDPTVLARTRQVLGSDFLAKVQAHHEDYRRPLDVRWLCTKHHGEVHDERLQRVPHLLVIGEAPTARSSRFDDSPSGRRLARILGTTKVSKVAVHVNVFDRPLGRLSPERAGDRWPEDEARERGRALYAMLPQAPVVLLGKRVADAVLWRSRRSPLPDRIPGHGNHVLVVQHPSGTNRFWNEPKAEEDVRVSIAVFVDRARRDRIPWIGKEQLRAWRVEFERGRELERRRFGMRSDRGPK